MVHKVSVFMPTYNQEKYIAEAIESVLSQTYKDWVLYISDDCSTDSTFEIVQSYAAQWPDKIKAYRQKKNLGVTGNCTFLLSQCEGEYVAFTAGDDLFMPTKLDVQISEMEANRGIALSYHDVEVFQSETGRTLFNWNKGKGGRKPVIGPASSVARKLTAFGTGFMAAQSIVVRSKFLPEKLFDKRIPVASDWLLWIDVCAKAAEVGSVVYINETMARYRKHGESITAMPDSYSDDPFISLAIVEANYRWLRPSVKKGRSRLFYSEGVANCLAGDFSLGRQSLIRSLIEYPRVKTFAWIVKSIMRVR